MAAPPGPKAPGTLAEGEPHRPDILTLSPTLECWNEVFLVNTVEIPTTYFLLTDQSYRRAGRADDAMIEKIFQLPVSVFVQCGLERLRLTPRDWQNTRPRAFQPQSSARCRVRALPAENFETDYST